MNDKSVPSSPSFEVRFDDYTTLEATHDNATLYTFAGELATRSHIFIEDTRNIIDGECPAYHLFADFHEDFTDQAMFMIANGFTCHLALRSIDNLDERAFQAKLASVSSAVEIPDSLEGI